MRALAAVAFLALVMPACERGAPAPSLVVFAAASLREPFTALADELERTRPGLEVTLQFAGSQELRTQLEHGAPADVFASADARQVEVLVAAGRLHDPKVFAHNHLVVVLRPDAEARIRSFADLPRAERIVVGAPEGPIGAYTERALARAAAHLGPEFRSAVEAKIVSRELNVRQVLAKVALGEADAGIVYRTDVRGPLPFLPLPAEVDVVAEYPVALVTGSRSAELARVFQDQLLGGPGARRLAEAGFQLPVGAPE